ncbi:MAG: hypothetical protein OXG33_05330 [Chloroflexi bacterium]|nr:hypothetical protein [Chloroflexota bacterium]
MRAEEDRFGDYWLWNDAIARHYLSGEWRNRPLYLDLDAERLQELAAQIDASISDPKAAFRRAVRRTLDIDWRANTFKSHASLLEEWEEAEDGDTPPFMGLLAFFTLAAEAMQSDAKFRATNYYGRLAQAVEVEIDHPLGKKLQRDFRKWSHLFWDSLNAFLVKRDGRLGRPTAFAFDSRVHVGIPISQALMRDEDRQCLSELFAENELAPGSFSVEEMEQLLDEWIGRSSSQASSNLRRLWGPSEHVHERGEIRIQIAAIACDELAAWDGVAAQSTAPGQRRFPLRLVADVRTYPSRRLDLRLRLRAAEALPGQTVTLSDASEAARAAFETCGDWLTLAESIPDGWCGFSEDARISIPDVLIANVKLSDRDGDIELERRAKQIVMLAFDQERHCYVEIDRISLLANHALLVRSGLESEVMGFLEKYARPGCERFETKSMSGCPEGWTLIRNVSVAAVPEDELSDDLLPLVPTSSAAIAFSGGLALPERQSWHAALPPEVSFSTDTNASIDLVVQPILEASGADGGEIALGRFEAVGVAGLGESNPAAGEYRVAAYGVGKSGKRSSRPVATATVRLRSANAARPLDQAAGLRRAVFGDPSWATVSAMRGSTEPGEPVVAGGVAELERVTERGGLLPSRTLEPAHHAEDRDEAPTQGTTARSGAAPSCFVRSGAHYWDLGEGVANENRRRLGRCKRCGLTQWQRTRPTRRRRRVRDVGGNQSRSERPARALPRVIAESMSDQSRTNFGIVLDAISLIGEGTWAALASLARHIGDSPWFTSEFARQLAGLGYIEIERNRETLAVERWSVAPPALAGLPYGDAFLTGFRSDRLLDQLRGDVEELGGSFDVEPVDGVPPRVRVTGLEHADLCLATESSSAALGFEVRAVDNVAARLLSGLPHIARLVETLPKWRLPHDDIERFNAASGRWTRTDRSTAPGAIRTRSFPRTYAFVPPITNGRTEARLGSARLVKHLESVRSGAPLVAYDPERRELAVRLGAQLPGLYERVAMLCSGSPPQRFDDGTHRYASVPPEIAAGLWTRLQSNGVAI